MADKVTIELEVLAKRALDSVDDFSNKAQRRLDSINFNTTISAISAGMDLIGRVAGPVLDALTAGFNLAAKEALEAEQASINLANALRLTNEYSEANVESFESLAEKIQQTTIYSDDAALSAASLAKAYNLSNAEARNVVRVSTDLAARLGIDLNSATEKVSKTLTGFVDRDLGRMITGLRGLSKEQLIAGQGLEVIQKNAEGSAAALANSFGGALSQLRNNFNEVFEQIGRGVLSTPELLNAIKALSTQFAALAVFVAKVSPQIASFTGWLVDLTVSASQIALKIEAAGIAVLAFGRSLLNTMTTAIGGLIEAIPAFFDFLVLSSERGAKKLEVIFSRLNPFAAFGKAIDDAGKAASKLDPIAKALEEVKKAIASATNAASTFKFELEKTDGAAAAARLSALERERIEQEYQQKRVELEKLGLSEIEKANLEFNKQRELINKAAAFGFIETEKEKQRLLLALEKDNIRKIEKLREQEQQKFASEGLGAIFKAAKDGQQLNSDQITGAIGGFATSIVSGIRKGAAGAAEAVAGVVGGVATAFFGPVIGNLIQQITSFLAQGPEAVKKQIREFELAVPDVVQNILEAIPAAIQQVIEDAPLVIEKIVEMIPRVIDSFIASIPKIIQAFIDAIPRIIEKLAEAMPRIFTKIATIFPQIAAAFIKALIQGLPGIFKIMTTEFLKLPKILAESIVEAIKEAFSSIGNLFGGGGGGLFGGGNGGGGFLSGSGIPIISDIGDFLGLAGGGRIPDLPQYEGDRFPARLSAGEQVLSKDLSSKLDAFLAGSQGGAPTVVQITIGQRELARVLLDLNRNGFRTA